MKISSIYNGRLYTMPIPSQPSNSELKFINRVISQINVDIDVKDLDVLEVTEDYDMYRIFSKDKVYSFKFSYDHENKFLLKEIKNSKSLKVDNVSRYIEGGTVTVGEKILYLLSEFHNGEPIMNVARSYISSNFEDFLESYRKIHSQKLGRLTYKGLSMQFLKDCDVKNVFSPENILAINSHSDFEVIRNIVSSLRSDIKTRLNKLNNKSTGLLVGGLHPCNIFVDKGKIFFDDLRFVCKGHVFSDLSSLILSFGIKEKTETQLVKSLCSYFGLDYDKGLYNDFYNIELRKHCISYLLRYLKEVYIYESQRVYEIVRVIDEFSLCYERMCKIPVFKENRGFIRKNITEPVLEDGPNS